MYGTKMHDPSTDTVTPVAVGGRYVLSRERFPALLDALQTLGYRVVGPTLRDRAIVYGVIGSETDLPIGWTDRQEAGQYRLERRSDAALFGYNVGPHSWKKYLFPAHERLWTAQRTPDGFSVAPEPPDFLPTAFLGVRACEIAAIRVQDHVFLGGVVDPSYRERRNRILTIAVQCGQAGATCFCVSMGTGPAVKWGFDLSLTELVAPGSHRFLVEVGSAAGASIAERLPLTPATPDEREAAGALVAATAATMGRTLTVVGLKEALQSAPNHPAWADVARRCLSCENCTLACPTCFCSTTEEVPDLDGDRVERWRRWDSCFASGFSELHGNPARAQTASRYRQWMTHKLAGWFDQFGESGCVGCGRCITWCPVGIDITREAAAVRQPPAAPPAGGP
jgi:sulfhydrogenase subunit beta (sulfur reductase)